jgi:peptide/nickel transport system substrate-binding protein
MYEYPVLVQYDTTNLSFAPDLATSWTHNSDDTVWTFKLVPNAKWSDGQPMTASDVAWTFNTIVKYANGPTSNSAGYVAHMQDAVAQDPTTVVVNYKAPVANALAQLEQVVILPEHVWQPLEGSDGKGLKSYSNLPSNGKPVVCGGPFCLTQYTANQASTWEYNKNWYGPKPFISGFGLQYFATQDAAVQALKTGAVDVVWDNSIPTTAVQSLKQAGISVSVTSGTTFDELNFNSSSNKTTNLELQNPTVRAAISHAIDFNSIVNTAWNGMAQPGTSLVPPASGMAPGTGKPWADPSIKTPTFDLTLAGQMLDQAGFKMGPNGYRIAPGQPCTYSQSPCEHQMQYQVIVPHAELGSAQSALTLIQDDLKKIGIGITQKVLNDGAAWTAETANHYGTYDMSIWAWGAGIDPDFILSVLTCASRYTWSDTAFCNKQYDTLYSQQGEQADPNQRLQTVYQMEQIQATQMPFIVLNYEDNRNAWSSHWTGFVPSPLGEFNYISKQSLLQCHKV